MKAAFIRQLFLITVPICAVTFFGPATPSDIAYSAALSTSSTSRLSLTSTPHGSLFNVLTTSPAKFPDSKSNTNTTSQDKGSGK
jgi:hypothetical protein